MEALATMKERLAKIVDSFRPCKQVVEVLEENTRVANELIETTQDLTKTIKEHFGDVFSHTGANQKEL